MEQYVGDAEPLYWDTCPRCGTRPYPAGSCIGCGFMRPVPTEKRPVFSDNNLPAIVFVAVVWIMVLSMLFGLFFRFLGS